MSPRKINVAIIGAGLIGKKRAAAVISLPNFQLTGVFDTNFQAAENFAKEFSTRIFKSIDEVLEDGKVDLVILAIVHKYAAELAPQIVKKKHLLIEKPAGRNFAEAKKIIDSAKKSGYKIFVGFNYRYYPHVVYLKEFLVKKKLGQIVSSTFRIGHAASPGYEKTWKMDKDLCGGGVILDPGIHFIDLATHLLGSPKSFSVSKSNFGWKTKVEDEAMITFAFKDKSFSLHHYSLNFAKNTFFIEVVGTKGIARLSGRGGNYGEMVFEFTPKWFWQGKQVITENFGKEDNSFENELEALGIEIGKDQDKNYGTILDEMRLVDRIYS